MDKTVASYETEYDALQELFLTNCKSFYENKKDGLANFAGQFYEVYVAFAKVKADQSAKEKKKVQEEKDAQRAIEKAEKMAQKALRLAENTPTKGKKEEFDKAQMNTN